ncbi:hypothetical protein GX51_00223, partial [Blastomyces parvus]
PEKEGHRFTRGQAHRKSHWTLVVGESNYAVCMNKHVKCRTSASQQVPDAPSADFET